MWEKLRRFFYAVHMMSLIFNRFFSTLEGFLQVNTNIIKSIFSNISLLALLCGCIWFLDFNKADRFIYFLNGITGFTKSVFLYSFGMYQKHKLSSASLLLSLNTLIIITSVFDVKLWDYRYLFWMFQKDLLFYFCCFSLDTQFALIFFY